MRPTTRRAASMPMKSIPSFLGVAFCSLALCALVCAISVSAQTSDGKFNDGQVIDVWANKIGPYSSPTESYGFYENLPWCRPETLERHPLKLGETLAGDLLVKSQYTLSYMKPQADVQLCERDFTAAEVNRFLSAIKRRFVYELLLDDLPMKLFVGETSGDGESTSFYIYTHIEFTLSVNGPHIIEVSASSGIPFELKVNEPTKLRFSYSVKWEKTDFPYDRRSEKYRDPHHNHDIEIHWFSIGNAILCVFLVMGLLGSILLRVIKKDFREYEELDADEESDDFGWKLLYGDVFRFPPGLTILCPLLGTGVQLLALLSILLILGALEFFHPLSRGTLHTTAVCAYAATAGVAGFSSGYLYKQMGGSAWMRNALITVFFFCGPAATMWLYLNTVAIVYNSTRALPFWTVSVIALLWAVVTIPLTILGAIFGKNQSRPFDAPGRTTKIPREIPESPWYRQPPFVALVCGLMPFTSIYVELYFIFGAVWGHKIFQVYEMLAIVFGILVLVTTVTTASAVYFQLVVENYQWPWASVFYGGSVGMYVLAYSVFYYLLRSPFEGFMQANFFFGNMVLVSYAFFLMCGTIGFFSARRFVRFLYSSVKSD